MYSHDDYNKLIDRTVAEIKQLSTLKGGEYARDNDRLDNFRRNGEALGLPMEVVWSVYYAKHHDAIMTYVRDILTGTKRRRAERIEGRIDDMIVYLLLFKAMLEEREKNTL
jgi:hypothetical protein